MPTLAEIDAELIAAIDHLAALQAARLVCLEQRRVDVIAAFDGGASREKIAADFGVSYAIVGNILSRAGRNERQRRGADLKPRQRADYERLIRQGVTSKVARAIATNIGV